MIAVIPLHSAGGDDPEGEGENQKRGHTEDAVFALKPDGYQTPCLSLEFRSREAGRDLDNPISLCRVWNG